MRSIRDVRILVTLQPQMYREALAVALRQHRPDDEVMLAAPGALDGLEDFEPDLLVHNDNDGLSPEVLDGVARVEVLYSDSMDTKIVVENRVQEMADMSVEELLRVVDEVEGLISGRAVR